MGNWNLPPGCSDADIPGNRPIDQEWEKLIEWLCDCGLQPGEIKNAIKEYIDA